VSPAGAALLESELRRLARDTVVLRALVGPPVVLTVTLGLTVGVVTGSGRSGPVLVHDPALAETVAAVGLPVQTVPDVLAALDDGVSDRGVVRREAGAEGVSRPSGWLRWSGRRSREDLLLEAAARDAVEAGWRLEVPEATDPAADLPRQVGLLARVLSVLYTLYAVVLGAALSVRDRESGVLEAMGAVPLPGWVRPLCRAAAIFLGVGGALVFSQLMVGVLLGHGQPLFWAMGGLSAVAAGLALGLAAPAGLGVQPAGPLGGAPDGLSKPLSRALVAATALGGLGWTLPSAGRWLPIAALAGPAEPLPLVVAGGLAMALVTAAVLRVGRVGW
jgi:hypothetical protein